MPSIFSGTVVLRAQNGRKVSKVYELGLFDEATLEIEFGLANSAFLQLAGSLGDVTNATICKQVLTYVIQDEPQLAGGGDVTEYALLNCWTLDEDDPTANEHISQHYIPAPVVGIFAGVAGADLDRVDRSDLDLAQYIQQISQHAYISDGETVQLASGVNGLDSGKRIVRKYSPSSL